jgi:hypothetical protein
MQHAALAVRHFGTNAHTSANIALAVNGILEEYGLPEDETPVTTDHGSNVVAALRNSVRLDCFCHRFHTVLETAWRETMNEDREAAAYETAVCDLCRFAKQSTGIQEQLPKSLKHGGDTRPWISMFRRADSIECSYETLVPILTAKDKLDLIANVNRSFNKDILNITKSIKDILESLEKNNEPTLNIVVPSYYLMVKKLQPTLRESHATKLFRSKLLHYLDQKLWTSVKALHWIACFMDPTFKSLQFLPTATSSDLKFKRDVTKDIDTWILSEMDTVAQRLTAQQEQETQPE